MSELEWNDEKGWGFLAADEPCKKDFWEEYCELDDTSMGRVITAVRKCLVYEHSPVQLSGDFVDVGIGGGSFVMEMGCDGFDVNPSAIRWLKKKDRWWDGDPVQIMTFWDSLEHIEDPGALLEKVEQLVFVSTPIYLGKKDCLASKHYKPGEHLWYFTEPGICRFMREYGFECIVRTGIEQDVGREGVVSFVFERR